MSGVLGYFWILRKLICRDKFKERMSKLKQLKVKFKIHFYAIKIGFGKMCGYKNSSLVTQHI